ncbi:hypothetical protein BLNAU_15592 [Blattamonas nauphoetae]|uniref:Uncharacterized protein n=1 Tax=Blattamonas nauphoetae TaxID=2049346 RepID=A0ABQ9XCU1_9EUKA|nr:hypothetical protein BLNAU_15592 [Blattamonas nauphoetae]
MTQQTNKSSHFKSRSSYILSSSPPSILPKHLLFLNSDVQTSMTLSEAVPIYLSLSQTIQDRISMDESQIRKAIAFITNLSQPKILRSSTDQFVKEVAKVSNKNLNGFVLSVVMMLTSQCYELTVQTLSFLTDLLRKTSPTLRHDLIKEGIISETLKTIHPDMLCISSKISIHLELINILRQSLHYQSPLVVRVPNRTSSSSTGDPHEMFYTKILCPSKEYMTHLCRNRYILFTSGIFRNLMDLFTQLIYLGPFHTPSTSFVTKSPVSLTLLSIFSFARTSLIFDLFGETILTFLRMWKKNELSNQNGQDVIRSLVSEGLDDEKELKLLTETRHKKPHTGRTILRLMREWGGNI